MFVVSKMTGLEKPVVADFEEFPLENESQGGLSVSQQFPDNLDEWSAQPTSATGKVREGKIGPSMFSPSFSVLSFNNHVVHFLCIVFMFIDLYVIIPNVVYKLLPRGWESCGGHYMR